MPRFNSSSDSSVRQAPNFRSEEIKLRELLKELTQLELREESELPDPNHKLPSFLLIQSAKVFLIHRCMTEKPLPLAMVFGPNGTINMIMSNTPYIEAEIAELDLVEWMEEIGDGNPLHIPCKHWETDLQGNLFKSHEK